MLKQLTIGDRSKDLIIGILVLCCILALIRVVSDTTNKQDQPVLSSSDKHLIRYVVREEIRADLGDRIYSVPYDGHANITYSDGNGGSSQVIRATMPWEIEFSTSLGAFVYVSAQAQEDLGSGLYILVQIYVDGVLVKKSESSGDFAIATTSGRL